MLLIKRSPHKRLFPNKINGLGGHVEHDEDVATAVTREIMEEANTTVTDLWLSGVVNVDVALDKNDTAATNGVPGVILFVFTAQATSRDVKASEEGELLWVPLTAVTNLNWVGGKPDLLWQALDARKRGRPFFAHKKAGE
ncbi:MAG: NUDIX domain-containing protein [Chloroflexi bacterium]|nr:NUDIX domain-containing protein [Chloroflexota bacterium]